MLRERPSMYFMPNTIHNNVLIRHPAFINHEGRNDGDSIRQHHREIIHENAWKRDNKPIRLKDIDGFELTIPWRVGRTWRVGLAIRCFVFEILLTSFVPYIEDAIRNWHKDAAQLCAWEGFQRRGLQLDRSGWAHNPR